MLPIEALSVRRPLGRQQFQNYQSNKRKFEMNPEEPSLLSHLNEARLKALSEGGLTTVIYCGKVRSELDLTVALNLHRSFVEQEVNKEQVNVTGILMGQVIHLKSSFFLSFYSLF